MSSQDNEISRRERIITYIRHHSGTTKTEVITNMKGYSALATTHAIIKELIHSKIIIKINDPKNSQIHHLFINEENIFNKIDKKLTEIESVIDGSRRIYLKKKEYSDRVFRPKAAAEESEYIVSNRYVWEFIEDYEDIYKYSVTTMLYHLLFDLNTKIRSESDSKILNTRILEIMKKMVQQFHPLDKSIDYFDWNSRKIKSRIRKYTSRDFTILDVQLMRNLLSCEQSFAEEFLA